MTITIVIRIIIIIIIIIIIMMMMMIITIFIQIAFVENGAIRTALLKNIKYRKTKNKNKKIHNKKLKFLHNYTNNATLVRQDTINIKNGGGIHRNCKIL